TKGYTIAVRISAERAPRYSSEERNSRQLDGRIRGVSQIRIWANRDLKNCKCEVNHLTIDQPSCCLRSGLHGHERDCVYYGIRQCPRHYHDSHAEKQTLSYQRINR